jgi:hypothetical protein
MEFPGTANIPWDIVMPAGAQLAFIALNSAIALLALWFVAAETRRRRDLLPVFVLIGAGLAVFYEILGDTLVGAFYPMQGQIGWVQTLGRSVPLFIGVLYFWYMSVPTLYFLRSVEQGLTRSKLWKMYAFAFTFAVAYEVIGVNQGAWLYYGPQAFDFFGVPLWAPATYTGFMFVLGVGVHLLEKALPARHYWLLVPALPMLLAGGHCALALPGALALYGTDNALLIQLGAAGSVALSLVLVWAIGLVFCPDEMSQRQRAEHSDRAMFVSPHARP